MYVSIEDFQRISAFLGSLRLDETTNATRQLHSDIERGRVMEGRDLPRDVVTLDAAVVLREIASGAQRYVLLVLQSDLESGSAEVRVFDPLGLALFGRRTGDVIEGPERQRFRIEYVQQPRSLRSPTSPIIEEAVYA